MTQPRDPLEADDSPSGPDPPERTESHDPPESNQQSESNGPPDSDDPRGSENPRESDGSAAAGRAGPRPDSSRRWSPGRIARLLVGVLVALTVAWWLVGRVTAEGRRLEIRRVQEPMPAELSPRSPVGGRAEDAEAVGAPGARIRVLTWNIAHGRGDVGSGLFRNFEGGDEEARLLRLFRIAEVIRESEPDVVVLNEVDFQATWSGGVNQAEVLARSTGFGVWVEQRNYDLQLPFGVLEFGNALLTRIPLDTAVWIDIPPHRWIEAVTAGAKAASMVRLETRVGPLSVIPVHLEVRGAETRLAAVPAFERMRAEEASPLILAGDFNSAPPNWPQTGDRGGISGPIGRTAVGDLLNEGWRSMRAAGPPAPDDWTYPVPSPDRAIDWILVEPPLRVLDARVLGGTEGLSDHAPVLASIRIPSGDGG